MSTDNALTYVGPIMDAYHAAEKAGANALRYALECGIQLNLAKETVKEDKGKWKAWREKNLKVSEETERVYRRLADAIAKKDDVFLKCKSIRDAIKHLSGLDENLETKPQPTRKPRGKGTGSSATGHQPPEGDKPSTGLKAELENAGADEIIVSIEDDADKLEEIAKASIAKLTPDKLCSALIEVWDQAHIVDLCTQLKDHGFQPAAAATADATQPARPPTTWPNAGMMRP